VTPAADLASAVGDLLQHLTGADRREAAQLRADDQKVRALACELLATARKAVSAAEGQFRREHIPPPTRAAPFPPADAVADARRIEALAQAIGGLEGQARHAPVPGDDRSARRYRDEHATLVSLIAHDRQLIEQADALRRAVVEADPGDLLAAADRLATLIERVSETLAARRLMLV